MGLWVKGTRDYLGDEGVSLNPIIRIEWRFPLYMGLSGAPPLIAPQPNLYSETDLWGGGRHSTPDAFWQKTILEDL